MIFEGFFGGCLKLLIIFGGGKGIKNPEGSNEAIVTGEMVDTPPGS
jgi:hypothetical protein